MLNEEFEIDVVYYLYSGGLKNLQQRLWQQFCQPGELVLVQAFSIFYSQWLESQRANIRFDEDANMRIKGPHRKWQRCKVKVQRPTEANFITKQNLMPIYLGCKPKIQNHQQVRSKSQHNTMDLVCAERGKSSSLELGSIMKSRGNARAD